MAVRMTNAGDDRSAGLDRLTPKERECLRLVLENRSSKEIGRRLGISHTSVDTHIRRARAKLGIRDRYVAAQLAGGLDGEARGATPGPQAPPEGARGLRWLEAFSTIRSLVPPMETLSAASRLFLVLALATFIALIFGIVLNAMTTL